MATRPHHSDVEEPRCPADLILIGLTALAGLGLAGAATPAVAQAPDTPEDARPSISEIVMPEGERVVPGPAGGDLVPISTVFPFPVVEVPESDHRTSLDTQLRSAAGDPRLPSGQTYGVPFRLWNGPMSFGQSPGSWLSGGHQELDGSSMGFISVDLLASSSGAAGTSRDGVPGR